MAYVPNTELKEVLVTNMSVQCMFPMRPDAIAASDCCGSPADTAVERPDGMRTWRCPEHRGLVKGDARGPVHETVLTRHDISERYVISWPERQKV